MPELPEVETVRRDVSLRYAGHTLVDIAVTGRRTVRRHPPTELARLTGQRLVGVGRHGKYLLFEWEDGRVLVVHLRMSGQLLAAAAGDPRALHTHGVLVFDGVGELRFVDPRTFGELFVTVPDALEEALPELAHLGFDPLEDHMAWTQFGQLLTARRTKLKPLIMDQHFIAGIGNMYADEILFAAGLRPDRSSETLTAQEIRRLYRSMVETLTEAVKHRGASLADEQYRDLFGDIGAFQRLHNVYDREGEACPRCRSVISRVKYGGRSSFFCAHCQV